MISILLYVHGFIFQVFRGNENIWKYLREWYYHLEKLKSQKASVGQENAVPSHPGRRQADAPAPLADNQRPHVTSRESLRVPMFLKADLLI